MKAITMRGLWFLALASLAIPAAHAADTPQGAPLERTAAFDKAYAASFYEFDGCGDNVAGRLYRNALTAKLKQCPFSPEARKRFQARAAAQAEQSRAMLARMIEDNGGLPMRLEGMTRTCHEQMDSPDYRAVRERLESLATGKATLDSVVPQGCDAAEISP